MLIIETERQNLKSMKDLDHLNYSINQHMKKIKEYSDGKKIMELFQLIGEHSVKYSGMSFMRNKVMAKKLGLHVRTIQRYTKLLEDLRILLKIPTNRKNNRGQASNTYVILPVLKSVVSRVCHGVCHPFNPSFKPLKQEKNTYNNISNIDEIKDENDKEIVQYIYNNIQDAKKYRKNGIAALSSYVSTTIKNTIKKAEFEEKARKSGARKRKEQVAIGEYVRKIPFYDWTKSPNVPLTKVVTVETPKPITKASREELDELGVF